MAVRGVVAVLGVALSVAAGSLAIPGPSGSAAPGIAEFSTQAADGTVLRGDVLLPPRPGRLGTVLELSPYWNTVKGPAELQGVSKDVKPFLDAGFAVALVNLRGTGKSDGCFQWGSRLDWGDASRIITALSQQSWSNGNVGMYGTSYEGWSQFMAMADPPPALKAAVPISGVIDLWSLLTRQGAPISIGPTASTEFGTATSFADPTPAVVGHLGCPDPARHLQEGLGLIATGDRTPYYQERDLRPFLAKSRVPVLLSNGLHFVSEGHTQQFEGLWDQLRADRTRFVLGQWGHGGTRPGFTEAAVGWFDHYLRGGPVVTEPGSVDYQDDAGTWHSARRWPPPAAATTLYLSDAELIGGAAAGADSNREFQSVDPAGAVQGLAQDGLTLPGGAAVPVPSPLRQICGPGQVSYVSAPLAEDVTVAGNLGLDLTMSSDLPGGNLVATLSHSPGPVTCPVSTAPVHDSGWIQLDLRHWASPGASRAFPVDTPTLIRAQSLPLATVIPAGERLILTISATSPELLPDTVAPRLTIATGHGLPGSLTLPVVAGNLRFR